MQFQPSQYILLEISCRTKAHDSMHIILVKPQIPQNTGSIARTCAAMGVPLSIVGPIPFEISDRTVKRAGLDYWPWVTLHRFGSLKECAEGLNLSRLWLVETHLGRPYYEAEFDKGDALVFGSETTGLDGELLATTSNDRKIFIPMSCPNVRSLNLSNAVSIVLSEALRQTVWR